METSYAKIGRASLVHAIGPRRNFKAMDDMPIYGTADDAESLKAKNEENKPAYINDEHTYGTGEKLTLSALKLFLYLHFQAPDQNGIVSFDVLSAAEKTHTCRQSVVNSLMVLADRGYVAYSRAGSLVNCEISGYTKLGLPASQGGRGYITLNAAMGEKMLSCRHLLLLRLMLRIALDTDTIGGAVKKTSIKEFKLFLPKSYKSGEIREALSKIDSYQIQSSSARGALKVTVPEPFRGKEQYEKEKKEARAKVDSLIDDVSADMKLANQYAIKSDLQAGAYKGACHRLFEGGFTERIDTVGKKLFVARKFSEKDRNDMASVLMLYPFELFKKAFVNLYNHYTVAFTDVNTGALMRGMVRQEAEKELAAA